MIVLCPSCNTRFRHASEPLMPPATAECGQCDELFPLEPVRPSYVLIPRTAAVPTPVGMDDPLLAPQLGDRSPAATPQLTHEDVDAVLPDSAAETSDAGTEAPSEPRHEPTRKGRAPLWTQVAASVLPASFGGALAYHLATRQGVDPLTWGTLGAAMGLLVGWGALLWIRQPD